MISRRLNTLRDQGRRLLACLPLYPPLELIDSFGITPVVLWNFREHFTGTPAADRHLQNYTCSVGRHLSEIIIGGGAGLFEGIMFYNACDTLRNLPEILHGAARETSPEGIPLLRLHVPANWRDEPAARSFLALEINSLMEKLGRIPGASFSPESFRKSVERYSRARSLARDAIRRVRDGRLSYRECSSAMADAIFMPVEDRIASLEALCTGARQNSDSGKTPVMLSGILPPPAEIIGFMEEAGLRVAANDIAAEGRSSGETPAQTDDPSDYYFDYYFNHHPCSTLLHTAEKRVDHLLDSAKESGARGFVFIGEKFCEYEYFEIVHLEQKLKKAGIATLRLEISPDAGGSYRDMKTRIDAFAEMLRG